MKQFNITSLNGKNGFIFDGSDYYPEGTGTGWAVSSVGDINGDGKDDVIIGGFYAWPNYLVQAGQCYVVFGETKFEPTLQATSLDGSNGFTINGTIELQGICDSVSGAGDINGDGKDDIIIGTSVTPDYHQSYVVFGQERFNSSIELASLLNGRDGFVIYSNDTINSEWFGTVVSGAGDINGDHLDDIIVNDPFANPNNETMSGQSYVIFGKTKFEPSFNVTTLDGSNGFMINSVSGDRLGQYVGNAGDINGDHLDDIIISSNPDYDLPGIQQYGYVIFGSTHFPPSLNVTFLDGRNGFSIAGQEKPYSYNGYTLSVSGVGDVNADHLDDIIVAAPYSVCLNSMCPSKEKATRYSYVNYVIFGKKKFEPIFNVTSLNGSNGFVINGIEVDDFTWTLATSGAGDFNNDGIDDIVIGFPVGGVFNVTAGESYVIYGKRKFEPNFNVTFLDGSNGFAIAGNEQYGNDFGFSVSSAGDLNNDGIADIIIGDPSAGTEMSHYTGQSYVLFGGKFGLTDTLKKFCQQVSQQFSDWSVSWLKQSTTESETPENRTITALKSLQKRCEKLLSTAEDFDKWYRFGLEDLIDDIKQALRYPESLAEDTVISFKKTLHNLNDDYLYPSLEHETVESLTQEQKKSQVSSTSFFKKTHSIKSAAPLMLDVAATPNQQALPQSTPLRLGAGK